MKVAIVFLGLGLAVMVVLIYQAVRQEMHLRTFKTRMLENTAELKRKEQFIKDLKTKFDEINTALKIASNNVAELKKNKSDREANEQNVIKSLESCIKETANVEQQKSATGEAIVKLKEDHEVAKQNAGKDLQNLKEKILERDTAICAFADVTKEEARKLCGINEAQK